MRRRNVLINAMHSVTGGGVTYLRGILPELAVDDRFAWTLLLPLSVVGKLEIPDGVAVKTIPDLGFWKGHFYEQFQLPFLARAWGMEAMLCNANYVPLLARNPIPVIHTTPRAAGQAKTFRMKVYWQVLRWLTRLSLLRAPLAFSVAQHVIADYARPRTARKVCVANPAVDIPKINENARDENLVMTVGDFYPQKDYPLLLRAFKQLRDQRKATRLLIVGRPVDPLVRDEVLALVRELQLSDAVTLTGAVPHDRLLAMLQKASVYVNTSRAECFNIPVLEALACGLPCVLPDVDFQREVAGSAAVYIPVDKGGNIEAAFAVGIYGLLENPLISLGLRRMALERAREFSWQKTAGVLLDGVARVLQK